MEAKQYIPFEATHPGFVLKEELQARGIKQKEFALDIDMQPTMLNELIKEKRAVTAEIALSFEKALGIPADFWMRFQSGYELDCARIKERNIRKTQQIEIWSIIKQFVPVSIFTKLGLLSNSLADNIARIWDIYDVDSIDLLVERVSVNKNMAYYKKSEKLKNDQTNILGWSQLARWYALQQKVAVFEPENKDAIIAELKTLFRINNNVVNSTQEILNRYGIKFIVQERFKQSPIDGYSFWSNDNPTIVVTMRKKQLDNFAFTVMHELGHVFTHLIADKNGDFLDIEYPNSSDSDKEQEAHHFAQQCFLQDAVWKDFFNQHSKFNYSSTEQAIIELANRENIHPSVLLGRYCFETGSFAIKTSIDRSIK